MKGGLVLFDPRQTNQEAWDFFKQHCTFKILVNSSISALVFKCNKNLGLINHLWSNYFLIYILLLISLSLIIDHEKEHFNYRRSGIYLIACRALICQ